MKKMFYMVSILLILVSLTACKTAEATQIAETEEEAVSEEQPEESSKAEEAAVEPTEDTTEAEESEETEVAEETPVDYFTDKVTIDYASGFTVEYFDNYKVVTVLTPWDFATETFQYVLVQEDTEAPEGYDDATFITIPIKTIVPMSTTFLPFLDLYGLMDSVVAVSDGTYVTNQAILDMVADGLPAVGYGPTVDIETLLTLEPDVIMTNGYGFADYDTHPVLIDAGLPVIINGDYMDMTPLGRAEWGKFIAVFYNAEAQANEIFDQTVENYTAMQALVVDVESKPTTFLNTPWEGTWNMPGGQSFMANFINDAGGSYLWADEASTGSLYLGFEDVVAQGADTADIWLHPGAYTFSAADVLAEDERFGEFAAFQNGALWNNNKAISESFANDFYESGVAYPDLILADLIYIFHPEIMLEANPDFETVYYQQLP